MTQKMQPAKVVSLPTTRMEMLEGVRELLADIESGKVLSCGIAVVKRGEDADGNIISTSFYADNTFFELAGAISWLHHRMIGGGA